jgi:AraC family transcriptional regulator
MTDTNFESFHDWYSGGRLAPYVQSITPPGGFLTLIEATQPAGDMSDPASPELTLYQAVSAGIRVSGDLGGGRFKTTSEKGGLFLSAPDFANTVFVDDPHRLRSVSFPLTRWKKLLEEVAIGPASFDYGRLHRGSFASTVIRSAIERLWRLSDEEGLPSRLLAQAAGCEILAELHRLGNAPVAVPRGGLAPWAQRRCVDMIRSRLADDLSLEELAAEVGLSPFHFSRMFKESIGVPPRAFVVRLRIERACALLEETALPVTMIAQDVGYSSSQVLARVFLKYKRMTPSAYRLALGNPARAMVEQWRPALRAERTQDQDHYRLPAGPSGTASQPR